MKKRLCFVMLIIFGASSLLMAETADARPDIEIFSGPADKAVTVLVMPLTVKEKVPESEHFFTDTVIQSWKEVLKTEKVASRFELKTPQQLLQLHKLSTDVAADEAARQALKIAPLCVDAVMTPTMTESHHGTIRHGEQVSWIPDIRIGGSYWFGDWHPRGDVVLRKERVPASDEFYAAAALTIELRSAMDGEDTLLYGIYARDVARSGTMPAPPSLTKLADTLIKSVGEELTKIK